MAKKDNKSHHDQGITQNINKGEHQNSFIMKRDPRIHQQEIAAQNLAQNAEEGNRHYAQMQRELEEEVREEWGPRF